VGVQCSNDNCVCSCFGRLLLGPLIGVLLGFGAAYAAKKEGALGDSARAVGDIALLTREKAREIEEKHHVSTRSKEAAGKAWEKAKEMDRKHNILVKTKDFAVFCFQAVKDFCVRHRVAERTAEATGQAASWAAEQIQKAAVQQNRSAATATATAQVH